MSFKIVEKPDWSRKSYSSQLVAALDELEPGMVLQAPDYINEGTLRTYVRLINKQLGGRVYSVRKYRGECYVCHNERALP